MDLSRTLDVMAKQILNVVNLLKDIIVSPKRVFKKINNEQLSFEIYIIFLLGAVLPFIKTFFIKKVQFTFFESDIFDAVFSLIGNPKITWVLHYISFFLYVLVIGAFCKLLFAQAKIGKLLLCLMIISGIGILLQIAFIIFRLFLPIDWYLFFNYFTFFWCSFLAIMAIKYSQNKSLGVSILLFILPALPFILIFGSAGIFPSIAWLTF